ncbi:MAG TPA: LPS export ABC transporter permease LptF [Candidatus Saccharimonadia bacterium]|nr:LPS export ABC transporter permease LptF [Candidatus Saccharimonadia bacterium]
MRIIDRYLLRELLGSFASISVVLLLVTFGGVLTDVLGKVARGKVPAQILVAQVGLRSLEALGILLPLAVFIAVLMAYGRLYRDSEIAVLAASGFDARRLAKPLAWVAVPLAALLALVAFWLGPLALRKADELVTNANRSLLVVGMEAGRFVELPGGRGVVYVATMSRDGSQFERLFVHTERKGRVDIVTAASGELFQDRDGERFLGLNEGFRVEGEIGKPNFRTMRFERNDIGLPESESAQDRRGETRSAFMTLLQSNEVRDRAELHWRIGLPVSALVLSLLALPLARGQPREPRYGKAAIAVLAYVIYSNFLAIGRGWIADGTMPPALGLWWVHAIAIAIALYLVRRGERLRPGRA